MSAPSASDVLHITTEFDGSVHEYQLARSSPQLFAQLQQLTSKYPLTPLYIHYKDEDGDMVRVTSEAELREAVRVCGSHLNLVLSSALPSSSSSNAVSSSASQQPSIASSTHVSHTPSTSPAPASLLAASAAEASDSIDDIDDYMSSDDELFEQARSQVRSQLSQHSAPEAEPPAEVEHKVEPESPQFDVLALDSDEEEEMAKTVELPAATAPVPDVPIAVESATQPFVQLAPEPAVPTVLVERDTSIQSAEPRGEASDSAAIGLVEPEPTSTQLPSPQQPPADNIAQLVPSPTQSTERKDDPVEPTDPVTAIRAHLRSFYQLEQQRQAIVSSATSPYPVAVPVSAPSAPVAAPVPVATLFSSFFAEPTVIATIRDNASLLSPYMLSSSFPLFLHQLCLLSPALASHPLCRYTWSLSSLHPFTVCVHCSASPVIGRLLYCRCCDATLCGTCGQQSQHPADHPLTELAVQQYRREADVAFSAAAPSVMEGERELEERKASDFLAPAAELGDRMRASGQRAWKQGAVSLKKVDEMLTQFAADIKRMIESMLDGVFSDAPKQPQQQQEQHAAEEHKQQPLVSPRSRPQPAASGCNARRPPCLPTSRPTPIQAGIALAQPARQSMGAEARPPQSFVYRAQLITMSEMGLIKTPVEEETCKELLTASKGNVDQAVQWLMDKINV